ANFLRSFEWVGEERFFPEGTSMKADLLVSNAQIVSPSGTYKGHIYINGGRISAITREKEAGAAREIDAANQYVIPGMVDEHVHMMDPGYTDREDWTQGTKAAARGGITTVIDHHRSDPLVYTSKILKEKTEYIRSRAVVDFGQLGGLDTDNLEHLRPMWETGALGFKGFMCELHGVPDLSEGILLDIMREAGSFGGTVMLHCESDTILKKAKAQIDAEGRTDPMSISDWRNPEAEFVATVDAISLAELTGCTVLVAHVSQPRLLELIQEARGRGAHIYGESCPHYFYLDHTHLKERGAYVKFTPVVRAPEVKEGMRDALGKGLVDTIGTDHCPYPRHLKEVGEGDIHKAPFGIPGIDTTLRVMLHAVNEELLTLNKLVQICCEQPARLFHLYPRKGCIQIDSDADLVIVDMDREDTLRDEDIVSKCRWTPFCGWKIKGDVTMTLVRGNVVMDQGEVCAEAGIGAPAARGRT
ncbi:MAG: amidohydrolase family protein, partial [Candidatus Binatia bacterium]|nr:amidohydrolase family protein [Candidatus Binatia bacterium]